MNRRNFIFLGLSYLFVLFNYPLVRASSTTYFVEAYGAKASPQGWLLAVVLLAIAVGVSNRLQSSKGFHFTFLSISLFSVLFFGMGHFAYLNSIKSGALFLFAWKEVYIVLQVHLLLAYANSWLNRQDFLKWIGPLGALGSIGGILGGLLTTYFAKSFGTSVTLYAGLSLVFISALFAIYLEKIPGTESVSRAEHSPLKSLNSIDLKRYVFLIGLIVALSQIVINIADFQFSLYFEKAITDSSLRTAYLGEVYTATNSLTLALQLVVLPLLLKFFGERSLHFFIPISYLACLLFGLNSGILTASAVLYVFLKASDYSLFSAGKELLYHPMKPVQKYGAKYLTDMFVYRTAKASIAGVLIYYQSAEMLNKVMIVALLIWTVTIYLLFKLQRRLFH
ncbi:MAG: hypothetical protein K2P81_02160 [Bacteriovoracaceae bacterium]|nr:hypothetical protein [Bacteriovoracaceae bacterium]